MDTLTALMLYRDYDEKDVNMLLQNFLRTGGTPEQLLEQYAIKMTRHGKYPNLCLFKYNQIDSPMVEKIVQEARGVILDEGNNWAVVCRGFNKFFNYAEPNASEIDWKTARVQEKLDGSYIALFYYDNAWHASTSGMPDAAGSVNGLPDTSFAQLFWRTFYENGLVLSYLNTCVNYILELTTPYNRVVVPHKENRVTLIGRRSLLTGMELSIDESLIKWHYFNFPVVKSFPLQSMDDILKTFETLDPLHNEGYVVVDAQFNRVKVKHPGYLALHRLKGEGAYPTPRRILELIRIGEQSELLTYFPEWTEHFGAIKKRYDELVDQLEAFYDCLKGLESQKDFALAVKTSRCPGALFARRQGGSFKDYLAGINIQSLLKLLLLKEEPLS